MGRFSILYRQSQIRILLSSAAVICVLSWVRAVVAGTLLVDGHTLDGVWLWVTFAGFVTALGAYSFALYRLWQKEELTPAAVRLSSYALVVVFSTMLPMLSNDLFSLLAYGDAANRAVDVYIDVASLHLSPFFDNVSPLWRQAPCVYGPICLTTSRLAALIGGGHLGLAMIAYKILALAWAALFIELIIRIAGVLQAGSRPLMLILLNPLLMVQGIGQLHCDAIAIALAAAMIYFILSERWYLAYAFAGMAIAAKISYVLLLPFMVVLAFINKASWNQFLMRKVVGFLITVGTVVVLYLPYFTSAKTLITPFQFLTSQNPAKSIAEIVGDIVYFAPGVLLGENAELHNNVHTPSGISQAQLDAWLSVQHICQVFAIVMCLVVFVRFWMGDRSQGSWFRTFVRLLLLFLLFYSHVFYPWYLLFVLPLLWYESDVLFIQWLFVLTGLAIVQDTITFTRHETLPYYIILILTFASTLSFFWRFRTVYFRSASRQ